MDAAAWDYWRLAEPKAIISITPALPDSIAPGMDAIFVVAEPSRAEQQQLQQSFGCGLHRCLEAKDS
ncbi:Breast cancer anti-estrogen resistance protein 1 [Frankliniella fusca]|uniref:Breast cancer anti-estrogen resistance protein 1 n=1 Tax=Frankliniella fusca TaxID=407009 RepID=A0AAE1I136_9NEOP|nr:Breast cancer anti-estrogen resistance protein 1 [Frankliniella fusca]